MAAAVIEKTGTTLKVRPEDRLDSVETPELTREIQPYLADTDQIVMDFSNVDYVSSSGLRLLMWLGQEMEDRGGEVQITNANEDILKIFELVGFMEIVHVITE